MLTASKHNTSIFWVFVGDASEQQQGSRVSKCHCSGSWNVQLPRGGKSQLSPTGYRRNYDAVGCQIRRCQSIQTSVHRSGDLENYPLSHCTGNQWRVRNTGVMWSYFRVPVMPRSGHSADVAGVPRWHRTVDCYSSQAVHSRLDYCNSVLYSLPWLRLQLLQSVLNSAARLIWGLKRFDYISPVLIELHWLPYPQRVKYKVCMLMFKCLKGLAPAYLVAFCTKGSAVSGRSALRSAVRGDLVVPSHRTDWGLRAFAVAGPSCWNELPVELRDLTVGPATFAKHLKTHLFWVGFFW